MVLHCSGFFNVQACSTVALMLIHDSCKFSMVPYIDLTPAPPRVLKNEYTELINLSSAELHRRVRTDANGNYQIKD